MYISGSLNAHYVKRGYRRPRSKVLKDSTAICSTCANKQRGLVASQKAGKSFIAKAIKVHKGFYTYTEINYVDAMTLVKITCPVHGDFLQRPKYHLTGSGCSQCNWTFSTEKPATLYYLKVWDNIGGVYHEAWKVGITNGTVAYRYQHEDCLHRMEVLNTWAFTSGYEAKQVEATIKSINKQHLYQGPKLFKNTGVTELYQIDINT